jgi:MFS family permease
MLSRLHVDLRSLRHRDFRNLWLGQAISTLGTEIAVVAVPFQVYAETHSTALVGLLGLASLVPLLVAPIVGGAIADAHDRRAVLIRTELGLAAVALLFLVNALLPQPQVWALFVLQTLSVAVFSFGRPAMSSLPPRLVPDEELEAASAIEGVYGSLGAVAGPAVGGLVIAAVGVPWTFGIDAATYAASLVALVALPPLPPLEDVERPSLRSIREGFRFLKGREALLGIFAVDTSAMVFGMPSALFPAIALRQLHGTAATVGYLYAAPSAGALVGSLASGWVTRVRRQGVAVTVAACAWGGAILAFGFTTALWPALGLLALAGGADFYSAVLR